jgi:phosphate-selective porin OprO/OprP
VWLAASSQAQPAAASDTQPAAAVPASDVAQAQVPAAPAAAAAQTSAPAAAVPGLTVSWKDGKTSIQSDRAVVSFSTQLQPRTTVEDLSGDSPMGSFRIRRAKTKFDGWLYHPSLTFELQANWAASRVLDDALFNWDVTGKKVLQVRAGQFKTPFGRQELTSDGSLQFVDRSIVSDEFAKGRDVGVQLWGLLGGSKLEYRVGVFNGAGNNAVANDNTKLQYVARLTLQPFGDVKYSEVDFESKGRPLFALAAQFESNDAHGATDGNDVDRTTFGGDVVLKYGGLSLFAEGFAGRRTPETGERFENLGFNVQAGFAFLGRRLELAGRYAQLDPDTDAGSDLRIERGIALSYFYNRHVLKLVTDLRQVEDQARPAGERTRLEARTQLQFTF